MVSKYKKETKKKAASILHNYTEIKAFFHAKETNQKQKANILINTTA
jgi:hypothetical protein